MPAPPDIENALESVIDIFLSDVRHRERAAFILCDNLVEMTCKTKAKEYNYRFDTSCGFHDAWNAPGVQLPRRTLGRMVQAYRDTRNNMQHGSAAATVDVHYCATAIITAVKVIDRLWRNSSSQFPYWMQIAVRIIFLYSDEGDPAKRKPFEQYMQTLRWRGVSKSHVLVTEIAIELGHRDYWQLGVRMQPQLVEECLNELSIP